MNKLVIIVCLVLVSSFLEAKSLFEEYKTTIIESNNQDVIIADSSAFVVGASGIVTHKFDEKTSSIIAQVNVISKNNGKAVLRVEKFKMLTQGAFPDTSLKPQVGDEVTMNYLYNRALIVTPNYEMYTAITKEYNTLTWIHPDIIAGYLTKLYRPNPDKEIFQKACYQNSASIIFFAIKNNGYFVDCNNFNTIKSIAITENNVTQQVPFYSRITNIESTWFSWDSATVVDYNNYYEYLLGQTKTLKGQGLDGIILNLPFTVVERKDTLWK
ncbi:MAG: plasminogen-binding N-terminal domain-containing protein [Sulfurospirillaceae bacterium]|nr:plasminogen-binding N-terminal domain-containing protein [Sulfurospirillaceae bacterium]MDD2827932.1 plasminogen-binding N-terminal domain-containing protein [Sulfurospirillaceae bacterium]